MSTKADSVCRDTYNRQINPKGNNMIADMIPQGPYFVVTSWSPLAQRANTVKSQIQHLQYDRPPTLHREQNHVHACWYWVPICASTSAGVICGCGGGCRVRGALDAGVGGYACGDCTDREDAGRGAYWLWPWDCPVVEGDCTA